jgi:hypothetical protein
MQLSSEALKILVASDVHFLATVIKQKDSFTSAVMTMF